MTAVLRPTAAALVLAGVTVLGLVLRAGGIDQSLFGDEIYTYEVVTRDGLGDVLDGVRETESTPPLYYVLAWLSAKVGSDVEAIRVPSLVLGTAAIPATYLLGLQTVGRAAALAGSAIVALSASAIFYSSEARAYGVAVCTVTLALAALMVAERTGRRLWWVALWACATAALYSHYTAVFPLAAGFGWALYRRRERPAPVLATAGATALAYLPWVPSLGANPLLESGGLANPLTTESFVRYSARLLPGHPFVTIPDLPGKSMVAVFLLGLAGAAAALAVGAAGRPAGTRVRIGPEAALVLLAAGATPAGLLVYSLLGTDIYQPRFLLVSLPALALALGALVTAPGARIAVPATAATLVAVAVGGIQAGLDPDRRRPAFRDAAEHIQRAAGPEDAIAEVPALLEPEPFTRFFRVYFDDPRRVAVALPVRRPDGTYVPMLQRRAWAPVQAGGEMFLTVPRTPAGFVPPPPPAGLRLRLVERRVWRGLVQVAVFRYSAAR